ncbi:MAG: hypothetical protein WCY11_11340 [Novosphingobium sp.]
MQFKNVVAIAAVSLISFSAPAWAQSVAAAGLSTGVSVYGPQGDEVGKVSEINGETVVIDTGTHKATLGGDAFTKGEKGATIGYTKAQVEQAVDAANQQAQAKVDAVLTAGAALRSSDGVALGTIKTVNADGTVVVDGTSRSYILKRDLFAADDQGLTLRLTAAQINDVLTKSAAATATAQVSASATAETAAAAEQPAS